MEQQKELPFILMIWVSSRNLPVTEHRAKTLRYAVRADLSHLPRVSNAHFRKCLPLPYRLEATGDLKTQATAISGNSATSSLKTAFSPSSQPYWQI
jgi:hypothetical protein